MSENTGEPTDRAGSDLPQLGLGTWENTDPDACANAVETALEMGYRHIDTAQIYGNEADVGEGIAAADVDRDDVFLATKVWKDNLAPAAVRETTLESLDRLQTEYVDLLYVHWPAGEYDPEATLGALEALRDDGYVDRIGVSNFEPSDLEQAIEVLDEPPFANQIELHPMLQQRELRTACAEYGVEIVAYSPLARGGVFENDTLTDIAASHDVSAAQVSLAWLRQAGISAIPKATSEAHIADNWQSQSLELSEEDIDRIDRIETRDRRVDPDWAPWT
jgi:2,5-diketo-D-gluconate reductase B